MGQATINAGSVTDSDVKASAGIKATKLQHRFEIGTNFDLAYNGTVANKDQIVFVATASCTINSFKAKLNASATTGTTNFELLKNGTTALTGPIAITSTETTTVQTGTLASTSLVAGDVLRIQLSNSSGDGTGPYAWVQIDQAAS